MDKRYIIEKYFYDKIMYTGKAVIERKKEYENAKYDYQSLKHVIEVLIKDRDISNIKISGEDNLDKPLLQFEYNGKKCLSSGKIKHSRLLYIEENEDSYKVYPDIWNK